MNTEFDARLADALDRIARAHVADAIDSVGDCHTSWPHHESGQGVGAIVSWKQPHERRSDRLLLAAAALVLLIAGVVGVAAVSSRNVNEPVAQPTATLGELIELHEDSAAFVASDEVGTVAGESSTMVATSAVRVTGVVAYRDGLIAIGTVNEGFRYELGFWRTNEAGSWQRVMDAAFEADGDPSPADPSYGFEANAVAVRDDRIVIVGTDFSTPRRDLTAWISDDGRDWQRHSIPAIGSSPHTTIVDVIATERGFFAVGFDNADPFSGVANQSFVLASDDGETWTQLNSPELDAPGTYMFGVTQFDDEVVIYGSTDGQNGSATVWTSGDNGQSWTETPLPAEGLLPFSAAHQATAVGGGLLIVGESRTSQPSLESNGADATLNGDADVVAWWTTDGETYSPVDLAELNSTDGHQRATAIADGAAGVLIAIDTTTAAGQNTRLVTWTPTQGLIEHEAAEVKQVTSIIAVPNGYILTANDQYFIGRNDATSEDTIIWFAPAP